MTSPVFEDHREERAVRQDAALREQREQTLVHVERERGATRGRGVRGARRRRRRRRRAGERGGGGDGCHRRRGDATETREGDGTASACRSRSVERARSAIRRVVRRFQGTVRAETRDGRSEADASRSRESPRTGSLAGAARRRGTEEPASESVAACPRDCAREWTRARAATPRPETRGGAARRQRTRRWCRRRHRSSRYSLFFHASPPTSALSTREATTMSRARLRAGQPTRDDRSTARADGWLGVSSRATRGVRRALVELSENLKNLKTRVPP